ncbi:MAG TPA: hypothetical protein VF331_24265 [Polyangiales bacterium]
MSNSQRWSFVPCAIAATLFTVSCNDHGSSGSLSGDAGQAAGSQCAPLAGPTNLLQAALPASDAYSGIASDGQYVYFAGISSLYRVPISGGRAERVYTGTFGGVFAATRGTVAWVSGAAGSATGLTVKNAGGVRAVALPGGAMLPWGSILVDADADVWFELDSASGGRSHTWRWRSTTASVAEMPAVGMPDTGGGTNLYFADRGQIIWSNNATGPSSGVYATDVSTGTVHHIVGAGTKGFGSLIGLDATNVYGVASICPSGACPFTVYGVARAGGTPFVAYETADAYWTNGLQADASGLYWIDLESKSIYHAALSKGAPVKLVVKLSSAPGSSVPAQFALDACNLYWIEFDPTHAPRIMAIAK